MHIFTIAALRPSSSNVRERSKIICLVLILKLISRGRPNVDGLLEGYPACLSFACVKYDIYFTF